MQNNLFIWNIEYIFAEKINTKTHKMRKTKTQEKASKSFDYAVRQASKCRHERYQASCHSCPQEKDCDIQKRMETARSKM